MRRSAEAAREQSTRLLLDSLEPETSYVYEVGSTLETFAGGDPEHSFSTAPAAGAAFGTRVWVLGDSGTADGYARLVRHAFETFGNREPPDLWLTLGTTPTTTGPTRSTRQRSSRCTAER